MKHLFYIIPILVCLLFSCSENTRTEDFKVDNKYEYYPLEVGKYITYQVDSIVYDTTASGIDTTHSRTFVKEELTDTLRDNSGRLVYRLERSERKKMTGEWQVKDIWVSLRTDSEAERVEENLRFIKMVFPLIENVTWNGNIYIDPQANIPVAGESVKIFKDWSYEIDEVDESELIGDFSFDSLAVLIQADIENKVELRYSIEKYAKNIGMVYRRMMILDTQRVTDPRPWEDKAQAGFILEQTIIDTNW